MAIVNVDKYSSYVSKDWELPQLVNHFINEMNKEHLIIWATGLENEWTVEFLNNTTNRKAFREFSKTIEITNGQLHLINYENLTMAAQFEEVKLPIKHNARLCVNLDNGSYELIIRQLFDPKKFDFDKEGEVNFEIVAKPCADEHIQHVDRIFWWDNQGSTQQQFCKSWAEVINLN